MANFNLNKVILGGRITADPEIKQTTSGTSVLSFSVSVKALRSRHKHKRKLFSVSAVLKQLQLLAV